MLLDARGHSIELCPVLISKIFETYTIELGGCQFCVVDNEWQQ